MRDLDVTVGPGVLAGLPPALQVLFEAGRWYCGEVNAVGAGIVADALPACGKGAFLHVVRTVLPQLMGEPPGIAGIVSELERRMTSLLADPDPATIGARAIEAFADHRPVWPPASSSRSTCRSPPAIRRPSPQATGWG
jgi:hypothetical protein